MDEDLSTGHSSYLTGSARFVERGSSTGNASPASACSTSLSGNWPRFPNIPREDFASAVKLVLPGGEVNSGAGAVFRLARPRATKKMDAMAVLAFSRLRPGCGNRLPSRRPAALLLLSRNAILSGIPSETETFDLGSWLFLRALGAIYLIAFTSFGVQAAGLIGSHGISPVAEFLHSVRDFLGRPVLGSPDLLWLNSSDAMLKAIWIGGIFSRRFCSSECDGG